MDVSPQHFSQLWWREVTKKVNKAVVFIDDDAAECLHWNGGIFELFKAGAVCVRQFSSFETGDAHHKKAVFITSSPCVSRSRQILHDLIISSNFKYCVLMTAVHPSVQFIAKFGTRHDGDGDMSIFHFLEMDMLQWMGNENFTVEIFHIPLFMLSVTERLFITPPFRDMFPLLDADLPRLQELQTSLTKDSRKVLDSLGSLEINNLPLELFVSLSYLAYSFHSFFSSLNVREDIFSLGTTSGLIAGILEKLPTAVHRRKTATGRCSLLLVDRTLDLTTPAGHSSESFLDRILAALPHLPGHCVDVTVDVSSLTNSKANRSAAQQSIAPGCLASSDVELFPEVMEWLVESQQRNLLFKLHQLLGTIMPHGKEDIALRVTPHSLEKQVAAFKSQPDIIVQNNGLLQKTLAVTQTLKSSGSACFDQLREMEKMVFMSLKSDDTRVQEQLLKIIQVRSERGVSLQQLLSLLVHVYSLKGTTMELSEDGERQIQDALRWALLQDSVPSLVPEEADEAAVEDIVSNIMTRLRSISHARDGLTKYRSFLDLHKANENTIPCGLMQRLANDLTNMSKPDIPDITCQSSGIRDFLKSGISLLLNRPRQQHPLDHPLVVIFVVGGITAQEAQQIESLITEQRVLVGGTRLVTADDIFNSVFVNDPLMQNL